VADMLQYTCASDTIASLRDTHTEKEGGGEEKGRTRVNTDVDASNLQP